jgi:hypothetical protein
MEKILVTMQIRNREMSFFIYFRGRKITLKAYMFLKVPGDVTISCHKFLELWPIAVLIEIEFYFTSCLAYMVL